MILHCVDGPLSPGISHPAPTTAPASSQQHPHVQGGVHHSSKSLGSIGNPERSDVFEKGGQEFSTGTNGTSCTPAVGSTSSKTMVSGSNQGKFLRGTDRAKLACVGCRRDNKKVSLYYILDVIFQTSGHFIV